jgi:hypothetical protein
MYCTANKAGNEIINLMNLLIKTEKYIQLYSGIILYHAELVPSASR